MKMMIIMRMRKIMKKMMIIMRTMMKISVTVVTKQDTGF